MKTSLYRASNLKSTITFHAFNLVLHSLTKTITNKLIS